MLFQKDIVLSTQFNYFIKHYFKTSGLNPFYNFHPKQCAESAQKGAQFFQFWYSLYQHIFILIYANVDENQKVERFASMIN